MNKRLWIAATLAIRGDEVHLKSSAFLAANKADAYSIAYMECNFEYPPDQGFTNHLASVGEISQEKIKELVQR